MSRLGLVLPLLMLAGLLVAGCDDIPPCPLCDAIEARDVAAVRARLAEGHAVTMYALELAADPNRVESRVMGSPQDVDREMVDVLLETADPNTSWKRVSSGKGTGGSQKRIYLAEALMELWGDTALLDRLIARGLDVRGTPGGQALRQAVISQRTEAVKRLIAAGAPVNHVGINVPARTTPLAEAIQLRDLDVIGLLEQAGAVEWVD